MKFKGYLGGRECDIEVRPNEHGFDVIVDGVHHDVDAAYRGYNFYSLIVAHKSYDISVHDVGRDGYVVRHGGFARRLRIVNPLAVTAGAHAVGAGPVTVTAAMAGRVVKLLVAEGDEVSEGQAIIVLEAMKMENDIAAPKNGRVTKIHVAAGQTVENAEKLVIVE